jgi:isoquinoline 1-oxidoreductase beta subunit
MKEASEYSIIGTDRRNVDGKEIVTGAPLFGLDVQKEGMLIAMIVHPPAFGMTFKSADVESVKTMPGIRDAFHVVVYPEDAETQWSDTGKIPEMVAIVGETTWQCLQAKKALKAEWEAAGELESTSYHERELTALLKKAPDSPARRDGPGSGFCPGRQDY